MKNNEFIDLLRDTIGKYGQFNVQVSKCTSSFLIEMLFENHSITTKKCDWGEWYFGNYKDYNYLPSLKRTEEPFIRMYRLYKELEDRYTVYTEHRGVERVKEALRLGNRRELSILRIVKDLYETSKDFVACLNKVQDEYSEFLENTLVKKNETYNVTKMETKNILNSKVLESIESNQSVFNEKNIKEPNLGHRDNKAPAHINSPEDFKPQSIDEVEITEEPIVEETKLNIDTMRSTNNTGIDKTEENSKVYESKASDFVSLIEMKNLLDGLDD